MSGLASKNVLRAATGLRRPPVHAELGDNHHVMPVSTKPLRQELFGATETIDIGRVEQRDAEVARARNCGQGLPDIDSAPVRSTEWLRARAHA